MKYLSQNIPSGKRILVRVDYNVPIVEEKITDDTRIKQSLDTITSLLASGNKVILLSHLGRPDGRDPSLSLKPVAEQLAKLLPDKKVILIDDFTKDKSLLEKQSTDDLYLLENIRFYPEEKASDPEFTKKLSSLADIYVNDGFSVSHRKSASTTGLPTLLPSFAGFALERELKFLERLKNPERPFLAIIGGGKISTKLTLLNALAKSVDKILLGGALANNLLKTQGREIGKSKYESDLLDESRRLLQDHRDKLVLPVDCAVEDSGGKIATKDIDKLTPDERIKDIGHKTEEAFGVLIKTAQTIVWNGPMGQFEDKRFAKGTFEILRYITSSQALTIVGGGDTIAAISQYPELVKRISFISTGGGALLEYLENGTLPAIKALEEN